MDVSARVADAATRAARPDFLAEVRAAGALHGELPVCVHRTPLLLTDAEERRIRRVLPRMHRVLRHARGLLLADLDRGPDSLAFRFGVPLDAIGWARIDPGFRDCAPLARLDAYVEKGIPRFLEFNGEAPAGMGYASVLGPLLVSDPSLAAAGFTPNDLVYHDPLPHVVRTTCALAREWGIRGRRLVVAIVDLPGVATAPEFALLAAAFARLGHRAHIATPDQLAFDGERLSVGGDAVHVLVRRFLVADIRRSPLQFTPVLDALRTRRLCMVNPLRSALLHGKGLFALLHHPEARLDGADRAFVARHIPYTVMLDDAVRERIRNQPGRWVLKPVDAHGGQGVVLGWQATRAEWDAALARPGVFVAQARVAAPTDLFLDARDGQVHRRVVDLGPFLARGRFAGFLCRLAEGELANVSAGAASQVPVLAVRTPRVRSPTPG